MPTKTEIETLWRGVFLRGDETEFHTAYSSEVNAIEGVHARMRRGGYIRAVVNKVERPIGGWGDERIVETRYFDLEGKEITQ